MEKFIVCSRKRIGWWFNYIKTNKSLFLFFCDNPVTHRIEKMIIFFLERSHTFWVNRDLQIKTSLKWRRSIVPGLTPTPTHRWFVLKWLCTPDIVKSAILMGNGEHDDKTYGFFLKWAPNHPWIEFLGYGFSIFHEINHPAIGVPACMETLQKWILMLFPTMFDQKHCKKNIEHTPLKNMSSSVGIMKFPIW